MRLTSVVALCLAVVFTTACDDDGVSVRRPPTAAVRFINANTEGWALDMRSITQVDWVPVANNLPYRGTTVYFPTEAGKQLTFRVFPTSINIDETSRMLHETSFTFQEGLRYTLLMVGSVAGTLQYVVFNDDTSPPPADNISVRLVNVTTGTAQGYLTATAAVPDPLPAATFANVGARAASQYVNRAAGAVAAHATSTATTGTATATGPSAGAVVPGQLPAAGVNSAGTKFSVYYFPAVTAVAAAQGRPAVGAVAASLLWLVDRNPAD
jgi:hypothetical protein